MNSYDHFIYEFMFVWLYIYEFHLQVALEIINSNKWKTPFEINGINGNKYSQVANCNKWCNKNCNKW